MKFNKDFQNIDDTLQNAVEVPVMIVGKQLYENGSMAGIGVMIGGAVYGAKIEYDRVYKKTLNETGNKAYSTSVAAFSSVTRTARNGLFAVLDADPGVYLPLAVTTELLRRFTRNATKLKQEEQ